MTFVLAQFRLYTKVFLAQPHLHCRYVLHFCSCATNLGRMEKTKWWAYVEKLIGDDTLKQAATRADFNQSAFTRWKNGARADPDFVVKLARAYGANVLSALVAADFITKEEAGLTEIESPDSPSKIPSSTIASEVERRLMRLLELERENVVQLDERRSTPDVQPELYAANRRTLEPEEGDDDFGPGA